MCFGEVCGVVWYMCSVNLNYVVRCGVVKCGVWCGKVWCVVCVVVKCGVQ